MQAGLIEDRLDEGSTPASIAQALVSEFAYLVDAPVTVTLSSSGTGIVIGLVDASVETGYSYTLTTASFYPALFGQYGSFSGSQTSGTLTGSGTPTTPPRDRFNRAAGELETMRASYQFAVAGQVSKRIQRNRPNQHLSLSFIRQRRDWGQKMLAGGPSLSPPQDWAARFCREGRI